MFFLINFPFPYRIVFPAGALGYIAKCFPVRVSIWLIIIIIMLIDLPTDKGPIACTDINKQVMLINLPTIKGPITCININKQIMLINLPTAVIYSM